MAKLPKRSTAKSSRMRPPSRAMLAGRQGELDQILDQHEAFLERRSGGARALLKFRDLSFLDFSGRNLTDCDLSGADLHGGVMRETDLTHANLFAADLRQAVIEKSNLRRADLRGALLTGVRLDESSLVDADLRDGVMMTP